MSSDVHRLSLQELLHGSGLARKGNFQYRRLPVISVKETHNLLYGSQSVSGQVVGLFRLTIESCTLRSSSASSKSDRNWKSFYPDISPPVALLHSHCAENNITAPSGTVDCSYRFCGKPRLIRNLFEREATGARPEDSDRDDDHEHSQRDESKGLPEFQNVGRGIQ